MGDVGKYAFLGGLVIALLIVFVEIPQAGVILAVLGLVVGFMNVSGDETQGFLLASIGLMMSASAVGSLPLVGGYVTAAAANFIVFISPAVLVVAAKSLLSSAKD